MSAIAPHLSILTLAVYERSLFLLLRLWRSGLWGGWSDREVCTDKSRIYDFAGTSIEHVYPRNADEDEGVLDPNLEPFKNTLGNLTIMDPAQNNIGGNDSFTVKQPIYQTSSVLLTQEIGIKTVWTQQEIADHKNLLIDAAIKIFRP